MCQLRRVSVSPYMKLYPPGHETVAIHMTWNRRMTAELGSTWKGAFLPKWTTILLFTGMDRSSVSKTPISVADVLAKM
jgi:hypothetical protein